MEDGGQRSEQPSVQLMLMLVIVIVIEIALTTNTQRPTPNIQHPIEEVRGRRSDVRNGESVRWRIRGQRPQSWPNGSVHITPKWSDSAAGEPLPFRARALRRGRAHHQQSPRGLGARLARASPRPDSIPARSSELTWPPVR